MAVPLQITFKGIDASPALEATSARRRRASIASSVTSCAATSRSRRPTPPAPGPLFRARVEVFVPRGDVVVTRESPQDHAHEDPNVAVRDAFDAVVRQLEDHVRQQDQRTTPNPPVLAHGRVARFVAGEDFGFIDTEDGQEVYFHRNSVAGHAFDRLRVGDPVRLSITDGEKGLQASVVHPAGRNP